MNRLPTKQIYLLMVIITGIIALSVYSTYAIFTFESETSDAFNIQLPSVLKIQTDMYEYKQIEIPKNSVGTTDIDLYNTYDYELCYSIWYKVIGDNSSLIDIYELSDQGLTTNGTITAKTNSRFTLLLINNADENVRINVGLAAVKATDTCYLKLSSDKKNIKNIYDRDVISLKDEIISQVNQTQTAHEAGSLIYKNKSVELTYSTEVTIANQYIIKDNQYLLSEPLKIASSEYEKVFSNLDYQIQNYYICSNETCETLYRINEANIEKTENSDSTETIYQYVINNVDEYEIYRQGVSGVKKVNQNYYYYGDNPHNYIYYNCSNDDLTSCELWRIIGLIYDDTAKTHHLKIIRNDSIGNYQYHNSLETNEWNDKTSLYNYLNQEYSLDSKYISIYPHTYEELTNLDVSINDIPNTILSTKKQEVTLMNLTDYLNTSTCSGTLISKFTDCLNNNWLNRVKIPREWTLTSYQELIIETPVQDDNISEEPSEPAVTPEDGENSVTDNVTSNDESEQNSEDTPVVDVPTTEPVIPTIKKQMYSVGLKITPTIVTEKIAVRPVVYLQARVLLYSGDGTLDNPYVIR